MAYMHTDPPGSLENVPEPDPSSSQDKRTDLEMESPREKDVSAERGGLEIPEAARSDEASQLDGDANPASAQEKHAEGKTKVGQGLESIGDLTADALKRIASTVGDVTKAPAVIMATVGSNANSPTSSCGTSLAERVGHLESQMMALATEFNLSPRSHPITPRSMEKLRTARSLLQETETKGTLVERMQILEDRFTEYMESNDKTLSIIQAKLAHIDTSKLKPEILAIQDPAEHQESSSGEEYHDAEQGSGNLESLETLDHTSFEEHHGVGSKVHGEARGISPTPQEALVKEPLAAPSTAESSPEDGADKSDTVLSSSEPQLASSPEEPQNALVKEPSTAIPSAQSSESTEKDADGIAAEDSPLTSKVEKPQETLLKEPVTAASTVDLSESGRGDDAGESPTVLSSSEPQLAHTVEEPQGALVKEPSTAEASAKLGEPAAGEKPQEIPVKNPLAAASTVEPQEPVKGDDAGKNPTELSSLEPHLASTVEEPQGILEKEPSSAEASANLEEPAAPEAAAANKTTSVLAGGESPLTSGVKEPQNDTVGAVMEDKHLQRESEYKAAEDVKVPDEKRGSFTSAMEPKPLGHREKKKKEKKQEGVADEKDKKHSLTAEDKSKQPFKHLRDRFRRAFRSNKDS